MRHDSEIQQESAEYGIPLSKDTVFCENDWSSKTPREFYDAYRNAVLVVILFDEQYLQSAGAYPEWKIIQDLKTQLHGRVIPVKFSRGADAPIREPNFFCGSVDLSVPKNEDEQAHSIRESVVQNWKRIVAKWKAPPDHVIISFDGSPPQVQGRHVEMRYLPQLCASNRNKIIGKIESGDLFAQWPKRSICVLAPLECEQQPALFEDILACITRAYVPIRRSSLRLPVFVPDGISLDPKQDLQAVISRKSDSSVPDVFSNLKAWDLQYRRASTLNSWLDNIEDHVVINVLASSTASFDDIVKYAHQYSGAVPDLIVNVWRWSPGFVYEAGKPFGLSLESLYHASLTARCNLIHLSEQFAEDLRKWKAELRDDPQAADILQDAVFGALLNSKARWRPFLTAFLARSEDRTTLSRLYCEADPDFGSLAHTIVLK